MSWVHLDEQGVPEKHLKIPFAQTKIFQLYTARFKPTTTINLRHLVSGSSNTYILSCEKKPERPKHFSSYCSQLQVEISEVI